MGEIMWESQMSKYRGTRLLSSGKAWFLALSIVIQSSITLGLPSDANAQMEQDRMLDAFRGIWKVQEDCDFTCSWSALKMTFWDINDV